MSVNTKNELPLTSRGLEAESMGELTDSTSSNYPSNSQFLILQQIILNFFSHAKHLLKKIYQQILNQIHLLSGLITKKSKRPAKQLNVSIKEIKEQAESKMINLQKKMQEILVTKNSFHKINSSQTLESEERNPRKHKSRSQLSSSLSKNKKIDSSKQIISAFKESQQMVTKISLQKIKIVNETQFLKGNWPVLEEINLQKKSINQCIKFTEIRANNLRLLNLSKNNIMNILFLKGSYFPILEELNLSNNRLKSIEGIQNTNFPNLRILKLSQNYKLKDASSLQEAYFPELIHLNLSGNQLLNVKFLTETDFKSLQILNLDQNRIQSLQCLQQCQFPRLKILSFSENKISSINFIQKSYFPHLQGFFGHTNCLKSVSPLVSASLMELRQISLHSNQIKDISKVCEMSFPKLVGFDLSGTKTEKNNYACFETQNLDIKKAKKKFPFLLI